jgi:hypothetical protein
MPVPAWSRHARAAGVMAVAVVILGLAGTCAAGTAPPSVYLGSRPPQPTLPVTAMSTQRMAAYFDAVRAFDADLAGTGGRNAPGNLQRLQAATAGAKLASRDVAAQLKQTGQTTNFDHMTVEMARANGLPQTALELEQQGGAYKILLGIDDFLDGEVSRRSRLAPVTNSWLWRDLMNALNPIPVADATIGQTIDTAVDCAKWTVIITVGYVAGYIKSWEYSKDSIKSWCT